MRRILKNRIVTAGALVTLALVTLAAGSGAFGGAVLPWSVEFFMWCLTAAIAASHRPFGGIGLGFGALVLPLAIDRLGAAAALVAATARLLIAVLRRAYERRTTSGGLPRRETKGGFPRRGTGDRFPRRGTSDGLLDGLFAAAVVALAAFAAMVVRTSDAFELALFAWRASFPALVYVSSLALIAAFGRMVLKWIWPRVWESADTPDFLPMLLEGGCWILGALLADVAAELGWGRVAPVVLAIVLLAAEAARNAFARGASDDRVGEFERLHQAHERILSETSGMAAVADQILVECSNILPVYWYRFELESHEDPPGEGQSQESDHPDLERRSWSAGPDNALTEGRLRPAARPPMLPGVHRRAAWHVIEESLAVDGEIMACVRLWCDPRQIEPGAEELFATLVPQMASSVHRARLDREARLDPLTGVPVRRILESALQKTFRRSCDEGRSMAVIMCDVDHFKQVNDTYGHAAGDEALILVARALDAARRENDLCCRYGGEEFTLLLQSVSGEAALRLAERLRQAVAAIDLVYEGRDVPLAVSAGVAAFPELHIKTAGELLLLADKALYEAKRSGRNRCLLNLGNGAFRSISGTNLDQGATPAKKPPRIFG